MQKYDVYGIGNALVDTEFEVTENFLREQKPHTITNTTRSVGRDARTHPLIEADEPACGGGRNGRCWPVWVARLVAN